MGHCASNSSSNGAITAENTALFKTWISKHKSIKNEEEFLSKCVNGGRVPNPFFPFQSSEVQSAKILFLDDSGPKGVQAGRIGYDYLHGIVLSSQFFCAARSFRFVDFTEIIQY